MKIWMIVAASLVALGLIVFTVAFAITGFQFKEFDMQACTLNTHTVTESFSGISIVTDTADIKILPSPDGQIRAECFERPKEIHTVSVQDGTLNITLNDTRAWYDHISFFSTASPKITVYLPAGEYGNLCVKLSTGDVDIAKDFTFANVDVTVSTGDVACYASTAGALKIKTSTGEIELESLSAGALDLSTSTGEIEASTVACAGDVSVRVTTGKAELENVTCKSFTSNGTTGDLSLENVTVAEKMAIVRDTGDVRFSRCDAGEVEITTDTGHVKGSFRTDKIVWAKTDTGRVNVPKSTVGGRCEITTDTGSIHVEIMP